MDDRTAESLENVIGTLQHPLVLVLADIDGHGLSVLKTIQGINDVDQLLIDLLTAQDQYEVLLSTAPVVPVSSRQMLMEEQNKEYEDSLRRDQEIERQQELERIQQEEEQMRLEQEESRREQEELLKQNEIIKSLPQEPSETDSNISKLNIRLPNGKRLERRFNDSDTLQVRNFVCIQ